MAGPASVEVHLLPELVASERLQGGVVVVVDVLRATTTIVHALAAGCRCVLPVADATTAQRVAADLPKGQALLFGERDGVQLDGFDLGNSPEDFTPQICADRTAIGVTTNGTRTILHAKGAARLLIGAFVNFSAICAELAATEQKVHLLCSGWSGRISMEDALFAGAVVDHLTSRGRPELNDAARLAWDCYEHHGQVLVSAFELSEAGRHLISLGFDDDLKAAAEVDRFAIVPVASGDPPTIVLDKVHLERRHFRGDSGLFGPAAVE